MRRVLILTLLGLFVTALAMVRTDLDPAELEARYATAPSKFVEVDGLRVHVRERGTGPTTLVLLHGSNSSLFTWEGWSRELSNDRRVISLDLPGHGLTGPSPRGRYGPNDMAAAVHAVLDKLEVGRVSLAGNSMGGHIALAYTLAHPERVERLILVDSAGIPREEPRPFALRLGGMPVVGELVRWITPRFIVARSVRDVYGNPALVTSGMIDLYDDLLLREGNRAATRERLSMREDREVARRLGELRLPVLILWGGRDRWIAPKYGERLRDAIAGAELVVLPELGHVPMEEDPARTAALARAFLTGEAGGGAADPPPSP